MRNSLLAVAIILALTLHHETDAELQTPEDAINQLYENLLQREYAGPISFPDHQVERKAQRSPSLRLRFGRSDPDMFQAAEKRWFGDVNQKPIRSPSLRLRFGRRSDPSVPLRSFDGLDEYEGELAYNRPVRKPARLRWGRSLPLSFGEGVNNYLESEDDINQRTGELNRESLKALLNTILSAQYDEVVDTDPTEFNREARKPLRLRFGRSTGGNSHQTSDQHEPAKELATKSNQKDSNMADEV